MVCSAPIPEVVYLRTRRICPTVLLWSPLAWFPDTFRDVFAGIDPDLEEQVEFGVFQKWVTWRTRRKEAV